MGADFLCLFVCVGVSSDSSSRFPAAFLVELRGVGVGAPGVSVPPRVVTIASSLLWVDTRRVRTATVLVVAALVDRAMWKRFWRAKISRPLRTPETSGPVNPKDHRIAIHQLSGSHLVTMSTSRAVLRSASAVARLEPCLSCRSRQTTLAIRYNATRYPMASHWLATGMRTQNYSINRKLDPKARVEVDTRARLGFYTICKQQSVLNIEPRTALSIYNDFVAKTKTTSHSDNVLRIVESRFAAHTPLYRWH